MDTAPRSVLFGSDLPVPGPWALEQVPWAVGLEPLGVV